MRMKIPPLISSIVAGVFLLWFVLFVGLANAKVSQWIGFGFGIASCFFTLLPMNFTGKERITNATLWIVTAGFAFLQIVVSIAIIAIGPQGWKTSIFVEVLVAAAFAVAFYYSWRVNNVSDAHEFNSCAQRRIQQNWAMRLFPLLSDPTISLELKRSVERAYDSLQATPLISAEIVFEIDDRISTEINELIHFVQCEDEAMVSSISNEICNLAHQRSALLASLNH